MDCVTSCCYRLEAERNLLTNEVFNHSVHQGLFVSAVKMEVYEDGLTAGACL